MIDTENMFNPMDMSNPMVPRRGKVTMYGGTATPLRGVQFKRLRDDARTPTRATPYAAGLDLYACIDEPYEFLGVTKDAVLIPTGIAMDMGCYQHSMVALIFPRSGLGHGHGLTLGNGVGVIDSDYQGEIKVSLVKRTTTGYTIKPGDRIAQLVFMPIFVPPMVEVDDFRVNTVRGAGGFGSTGG